MVVPPELLLELLFSQDIGFISKSPSFSSSEKMSCWTGKGGTTEMEEETDDAPPTLETVGCWGCSWR